MGISKRRIYDFINILESFQFIIRQRKNIYEIKPPSYIKDLIQKFEENSVPQSMRDDLISIKTKKHKSLGVLSLTFL